MLEDMTLLVYTTEKHAKGLVSIVKQRIFKQNAEAPRRLEFVDKLSPKLQLIVYCNHYNRIIHLKGLICKCFRADENGLLPNKECDLISQLSIFFGTHTSKKTWLWTPWACILGGLEREIMRSFMDPISRSSWYLTEEGMKKWPFNLKEKLW